MWIIIDNGETFEGTLEQFEDCFGGVNSSISGVEDFCNQNNMELKYYADGVWIPGKPQFNGMEYCCFKNPYSDTPKAIFDKCAINGDEVLYYSKLITEVYAWLPIPKCPYEPEN